MYQDRFHCAGLLRNEVPIAGAGGTAIVTHLFHRSGLCGTAACTAPAPQSLPIRYASPSPASASVSAIASSASSCVWYRSAVPVGE
jgi:hypothetical protein